ncbi:hypothetical protein E2562_001912 [Oryza meyeriana var. granulata]|uniref:Fungal lipase-like domain-containing protein n=1 Tax=Oryza meyeriana var. granulata TaxID=110450 RepID=A0A6G1C397_9ORYZ|nr:hypothetical protein E2562_001912 [Oryza meyeriana var. granulata]
MLLPLARFETSHVLGALLTSTPLLARAWDRCVAAADAGGGASSLGFMHGGGGGEGGPVYVAFSGVQAALSVAGAAVAGGCGGEIFKPVGLRGDAAGRLFAPLVAAEPEDAAGEPVAVQALALQGFLRLCGSPEFQVLLNQIRGKAVVFTGHSLGGAIAALVALHYLCTSSSSSACSPAPVLCVTFGSPLLGNEALSKAILRERWAGNFCHVVSQHDVVPRILFCPLNAVPAHIVVGMQLHQLPLRARRAAGMVATVTARMADTNQESLWQLIQEHAGAAAIEQKLAAPEIRGGSPYRPFGAYVLCSPDGAACVDNPTAAVQMLYATFAAWCAPETGAASPEAAHSCYGDLVLSMPHHLLRKRHMGATATAPSASNYDVGISLALEASGIASEATEAAPARQWLKTSKRVGRSPSLNCASLATRLGRITPCRAQIEWYKASFDANTGYYDAFKQRLSPKKFNKANMYRIKLAQFWDGVLAMLDTSQLPYDFHRRAKWVNAARFYQLLVEPLDIADYHRNNLHRTRGSYITHGRERRYELFDKWWKQKGCTGGSTGDTSVTTAARRSKFAGLTQDPCFWARVEVAREQTESAKSERDTTVLAIMLERLHKFERYTSELVESKEVSIDVIAPHSSYSLWVNEWNELKLREEVRTILFQF